MMRLLYEAANSVEAHMIVNLLEQAGLSARIDGEYLQGGAGELQAFGVVRVMVDDADYAEARSIIETFEANHPEPDIASDVRTPQRRRWLAGPVGFIVGIAVTAFFYNHPVTSDGIDYNDDGWLDEKGVYVDERASEYYQDRNFDKQYDVIWRYDRHGLLVSSRHDEDFDGHFETRVTYFRGNPVQQESDTDGDGFNDYRIRFEHGVVDQIKFYDPAISRSIPVKIQHFGPFRVEKVRTDTDGDGVLDTTQYLDELERPVEGKVTQ